MYEMTAQHPCLLPPWLCDLVASFTFTQQVFIELPTTDQALF